MLQDHLGTKYENKGILKHSAYLINVVEHLEKLANSDLKKRNHIIIVGRAMKLPG
jgi:hypothetical protein